MQYGTTAISYLAPKTWSFVHKTIRNSKSEDSFKPNKRKWKPECPCRSCKTYLNNAGGFFGLTLLSEDLIKKTRFEIMVKLLSRGAFRAYSHF